MRKGKKLSFFSCDRRSRNYIGHLMKVEKMSTLCFSVYLIGFESTAA